MKPLVIKSKRNTIRLRDLRNNYGVTSVDYGKMLRDQDGRCAICGIQANLLKRKLSVDHNHITGKIRGLLCHNCNISLGMLHESIENIEKMKQYIIKYKDI